MKKLLTDMILLSPFIAVYAAHHELIAMGVPTIIAVGLMVISTVIMLAVLIFVIDTMRNSMKRSHEPAVHISESIPSQSDQ
jgi:uncharacterized membrane protein